MWKKKKKVNVAARFRDDAAVKGAAGASMQMRWLPMQMRWRKGTRLRGGPL